MYYERTKHYFTVYTNDGEFFCTCDSVKECKEVIDTEREESSLCKTIVKT